MTPLTGSCPPNSSTLPPAPPPGAGTNVRLAPERGSSLRLRPRRGAAAGGRHELAAPASHGACLLCGASLPAHLLGRCTTGEMRVQVPWLPGPESSSSHQSLSGVGSRVAPPKYRMRRPPMATHTAPPRPSGTSAPGSTCGRVAVGGGERQSTRQAASGGRRAANPSRVRCLGGAAASATPCTACTRPWLQELPRQARRCKSRFDRAASRSPAPVPSCP